MTCNSGCVGRTAQDIEVKAGNTLSTFGAKFTASRNLALSAGDGINYFAVTDQKSETAKRNERTGWGIGGLFSIKVSSGSYSNSLFQLSVHPIAYVCWPRVRLYSRVSANEPQYVSSDSNSGCSCSTQPPAQPL